MNRRILLYLLLALPLLMTGCEKEKDPKVPYVPPVFEAGDGNIPIVFHVMWDTNPTIGTSQNPSNDIFLRRIGELNKFYQATLFPSAKSTAVDVTFTLATHDPDGNPMQELGVNRIHYTGSSDMSADDFLSAGLPEKPELPDRAKKILWDPDKYVNIWLFSFTEENVTGVAYLPYYTSANPLSMLSPGNWAIALDPFYMHGIALNNKHFSPPPNETYEDEGMFTLCHEMGHYLGLLHAYIEYPVVGKEHEYKGCGGNLEDNSSDDGCSDTPKYERQAYDNLLPSLSYGDAILRQACDGTTFMSTNIMDYYYGTRRNITVNQRDRIEHVLANSPWIPRSKKDTKALLENFTGEITDERPVPILMY